MRTVITSIEGQPSYIPVFSTRYLVFAFIGGLIAGLALMVGVALWALR